MPLNRLRIATLARLALRTQIRADERENRKPERGEARPNGRAFTFCTREFQQISRTGLGLLMATKGPTLFKCPFKRKRRSPDGGDGASSGSFGGNNVTGGKPSLVLA